MNIFLLSWWINVRMFLTVAPIFWSVVCKLLFSGSTTLTLKKSIFLSSLWLNVTYKLEQFGLYSSYNVFLSNDTLTLTIVGIFFSGRSNLPSCKIPEFILPIRFGLTDGRRFTITRPAFDENNIIMSPTLEEGETQLDSSYLHINSYCFWNIAETISSEIQTLW